MWLKFSKQRATLTDQELLEKFRNSRDLNVLGTLYDRYLELVFGVCLKYLKNEESSRDAVMHIFEHLIKKIPDHEIANFKSWLHVVTKNHCLGVLRKNSKILTKHFEPNRMHSLQIEHHDSEFELVEDYHELKECMEQLPEKQRTCIEQHYFEKKSYQEIAEMLETKKDSVRSYIQNGRRNLKNCLKKKYGTEARS